MAKAKKSVKQGKAAAATAPKAASRATQKKAAPKKTPLKASIPFDQDIAAVRKSEKTGNPILPPIGRKAPAASAKDYRNERHTGFDGNVYESRKDRNGRFHWVLLYEEDEEQDDEESDEE